MSDTGLPEGTNKAISEFVEDRDHRNHVIWMLRQVQTILLEPILDTFVSEQRDNEGRQFLNGVWLFTKSVALEVKQPLVSDDFDAKPLRRIQYLRIVRDHFDFNIPRVTESSRMSIYVTFPGNIAATLTATRTNCAQLLRITRKWFLPRLMLDGDKPS